MYFCGGLTCLVWGEKDFIFCVLAKLSNSTQLCVLSGCKSIVYVCRNICRCIALHTVHVLYVHIHVCVCLAHIEHSTLKLDSSPTDGIFPVFQYISGTHEGLVCSCVVQKPLYLLTFDGTSFLADIYVV